MMDVPIMMREIIKKEGKWLTTKTLQEIYVCVCARNFENFQFLRLIGRIRWTRKLDGSRNRIFIVNCHSVMRI